MKPNDFSGARVLVTGGAGFIGSALVWALNRRGCDDIVVCDRLGTDEKWRNLAPLRFAEFVEADDLLARLKNGALGKFNLVLHMGACSSTTERDAGYLFRNNFEFTRDLADWALEKYVRFVYASSAATYGDGSAGMEDDDSQLDALRPLNMYGYSKHLFDLHARRAGFLDKIVGLKYFNVFGPNEHHKGDMRSVVYKAFHQIQQTGAVSLFKSYKPEYADGGQMRDFFYVKDAAAATVFLAGKVPGGGLFNLGSGEPNTWLALVKPIFAALGREPNIKFVDMPDYMRSKYQYFTSADIGKLRSAGFNQTLTPLAEAVIDYVKNYLLTGLHLGDEPERGIVNPNPSDTRS
jgi:ADP-L-glycero-D-manno-heptose 6-epimerase